MAYQLISVDEPITPAETISDWRSYHVFYHGERNHMLLNLVCPLVRELMGYGAITRFFFIRYGLGGPHLRLRWSVPDQYAAALAEQKLEERAARFFASSPSVHTLPEEEIQKMNRVLLGNEAEGHAEDYPIYRNNSWSSFPIVFEQERYGGPERFPLSLELFNLTSIKVLTGLSEYRESSPAWVRPALLRFASQLAWSFAADEEEFISLLQYAERFMGRDFSRCVLEGDASFARRGGEIMAMLYSELEQLAAAEIQNDAHILASGAQCVAQSLTGLPAQARWTVAASHIHMTANRLGVNNAEEVYLSRIVYRAAMELRQKAPANWEKLWHRRRVLEDRAAGVALEKIVASAWRRFIDLRS